MTQIRPSFASGWRASDPGELWSVAYTRDQKGDGRLEASPPRLAQTLRLRCYGAGIDVAGDARAVLAVLMFLTARDGRPVALEALPAPPEPPPPVAAPERPKTKSKP